MTHLLTVLVASLANSADSAQSLGTCDLSEEIIDSVVFQYVIEHYPSFLTSRYVTDLTRQDKTSRTIVVTPLPATPDTSIVLIIGCRATVVQEINSRPRVWMPDPPDIEVSRDR